MKFLITIFKYIMNLIFLFMKLLKVKNKIVIISRQSDEKTMDIALLEKELQRQAKDYEVVCLCRTIGASIGSKISYGFHLLNQMYQIATSKVVIIDGYCMGVSLLKQRKTLKVIQMWHALGSLKKFGYSILGKDEGRSKDISEVMNMHGNYDVIFSSSSECAINFAEAFNYSMDRVYIQSLPRVDAIKDKQRQQNIRKEIVKTYPEINEKKNIVYAPTFRKDSGDNYEAIEQLLKNVDYSKYNLIIKAHPLMNIDINRDGVINDRKFSSVDMFAAADYIVLDYSAIVYEAALMRKPLFFYTYDFSKYKDNRDFYIDYEKEMPGLISENVQDIIEGIETDRYDLELVKRFADRYVEKQENCTYNMAKFIINLMDN